MGAFLSVAKGSVEEPRLLDISYTGTKGNDAPLLALVGKGEQRNIRKLCTILL